MVNELYPRTSSVRLTSDQTGLFTSSSSGGEVDLRQEMDSTLYGSVTEIAKGRPIVLRRMRRTSAGQLIECACVSTLTGEPDQDTKCPYCWGERYLWDEEWVTAYKMQVSSQEGFARKPQPNEPGVSITPLVFFYMDYTIAPTQDDKIVEVKLDLEGNVVIPITREAIYQIATAEDFRSDNGRVEYWRCAVNEESVRSTWE
jgi:hypothetical protein